MFDAFRLSVALDRNAGQIHVKALISSAFTKARDLQQLVANGNIDLIHVLSHETVTTRLERLSKRNWQKTARQRGAYGGVATAIRKFGTVGDAVVAVLSHAESDMRLTEIHREITTILDGPVSLSSVMTSLARNCKGEGKPFERVSHGQPLPPASHRRHRSSVDRLKYRVSGGTKRGTFQPSSKA